MDTSLPLTETRAASAASASIVEIPQYRLRGILGIWAAAALPMAAAAWLAAPVLAVAVTAVVVQAIRSASRASVIKHSRGRINDAASLTLIGFLHLVQPLARLIGRIRSGLIYSPARVFDY